MKNVLEFFEHTVEKFPNKVGFTDENRCSTFSEAMEKSKKIGTSLLQYGNRKAVAILIDKNCNCIHSMLGTLYAGDFYIVVDVHSPKDRIINILS